MSRASFSVAYAGAALEDEKMDVRDLAPALLSIGNLFDTLDFVLNEERGRVKVAISAVAVGSFEVVLELSQPLVTQVVDFFTGNPDRGLKDLIDLLVGAVVVAGATKGLLWIYKKLKGQTNVEVHELEDGQFQLATDEVKVVVPGILLEAYRDIEIRRALEAIVHKPLQREGIDSFKVVRDHYEEVVDKHEAEYFKFDKPVGDAEEVFLQKKFNILNVSFQPGNKWRLYDGIASMFVEIKDEAFLARVSASQVSFAAGDTLVCDVRMIQEALA